MDLQGADGDDADDAAEIINRVVRKRWAALLEPVHGAGKDCAAIDVLPHGRRGMTGMPGWHFKSKKRL
jgi:hypothetical protein